MFYCVYFSVSAGSCWSQQNSIDINDSRRPSEDGPLPMMHHHLHAIFKEHQIMSPIKEISSTTHQQHNVTEPLQVDEIVGQLENEITSEDISTNDHSPVASESARSSSPGSNKQIPKDKKGRAHSSASIITQNKACEMEERRASLSLCITSNKQHTQSNRLSPQQFPHIISGQISGKSRTRPSSPKKYFKHYNRCDSLSKLNNHGTIVGPGAPLAVHFPSNRYRTSISIGKKSVPPTSLSSSTNLPASGSVCANSRRTQWRRKRPMSLDTVLMKKDGSKAMLEAKSTSGINNNDQW